MSANAAASTDALEARLRGLLSTPPEAGTTSFAVDGIVPALVATPASTDELAAAIAAASEFGAAVVPFGAGRHTVLGGAPARYDVALRTSELDQLIEYEPADLTVTVQAGVTMGRLQSLLGQRGQFLPLEASPESTVGGVLAAGLSGPSSHAYGLPRDWLIGCRVAHADGRITKAGGRVVKNVAGYDMTKLYVGSLGTLGVIVEATFKVAPLPPAQETVLVPATSLQAASDAVFAAHDRGLAIRAVAVLDAAAGHACGVDAPALAAFWLAGSAAAVDRTRRELSGLTGEGATLEGAGSGRWWARLNEPPAGPETVLRVSLLPAQSVPFMERVSAVAGESGCRAIAYPTTGAVLATIGPAPPDSLATAVAQARRLAVEAGGSLIVTSAPRDVKERVDVWGELQALDLMRRLKQQFDPKGTLSPGRFAGGL